MLKNGDTELTSLDMKSNILMLNQPSDLDALPSPRVLATHRQFQELPSDFIIKKCKLILVVRDPKDICVSTYNLCLSAEKTMEYKGTFDGYISLFLEGKGKILNTVLPISHHHPPPPTPPPPPPSPPPPPHPQKRR